MSRLNLVALVFLCVTAAAVGGINGGGSGVPGADPPIIVNDGWQTFYWSGSGPVYNIEGPFTFSGGAARLTVVDAFCGGDQFAIYDNGVLIGNTSVAPPDPICEGTAGDPDSALASSAYTRGVFLLPPGPHAITIQIVVNPFSEGGAFLRVDSPDGPDRYQVRYLANLNVADSYVNISNVGAVSGNDPAGRLCANIYVFDPNEEPVSCCACPVTPNGLVSLSARNSLISNPLTPGVPTAVVVKILFTANTGTCDAGMLPTPAPLPAAFPEMAGALNLARGGVAHATTVHANTATSPASYQQTETRFANSELSPSEYYKLVYICNFIETYASKFGLCKGCQAGGLGAARQ